MESAIDKVYPEPVEAEQIAMINNSLNEPGKHTVYTKRTSNSIIMRVVFSVRTPDATTSHMRDLYDFMVNWSAVIETGFTLPADIFHFLK
jgi:hypothetical protein